MGPRMMTKRMRMMKTFFVKGQNQGKTLDGMDPEADPFIYTKPSCRRLAGGRRQAEGVRGPGI